MSHCKRYQEQVHREKDGFLSLSETVELSLHRNHCVSCQSETVRVERLTGLLARSIPPATDGALPAGFDARFMALVQRRNEEKAKRFIFWNTWKPVYRLGLAGAFSVGVFVAGSWWMNRPVIMPAAVGVASEADGLLSAAVVSTKTENEKTLANARSQSLLRDVL